MAGDQAQAHENGAVQKVKFHATVKIKKPLQLEEEWLWQYLWKYISCDCALRVKNPRCDGNGKHVAGPFSDPRISWDRQQA